MYIRLYSIDADPRQLTKITESTSYDQKQGTLRDPTDFLNPSVMFEGNLHGYNYMYIPDFNRYYFLDPPVTVRNGLTQLIGHVDVGQTFDTEIRKIPAIGARTAKQGEGFADWYLRDSRQPVRSYRTIDTYYGNSMEYGETMVFITAG